MSHPPRSALVAFARGGLSQRQARGVVAHLLSGCSRCREALVRSARSSAGPAPQEAEDPAPYARAFDKARTAAQRRMRDLDREQAVSRRTVPRLSNLPRGRQLLLVRNSRSLRSSALGEVLWTEGLGDGKASPERMVEVAELALSIASELERDSYGDGIVTDLRARAAAEMANALRLAGKTRTAREVMGAALELVENGTGDPLLRARVYDLASSLSPGEESEGLAARLLERAFHLYRRFGDDHLAGRVLFKRALVPEREREAAGRLKLLVQAADLIDPQRDRWLAWASIHSMLWGLVELGRFRAAAELLEESRQLYAELSQRLDSRSLARLEARIAAGLSDIARAEAKLLGPYRRAVRCGDLRQALPLAMDLAALLLPQGRRMEARMLIEDLLAAGGEAGLDRELRDTLQVLRDRLEKPEVRAFQAAEVRRLLARFEGLAELEADG